MAEPLVGLVDTFFVARLGAPSLAALGIAATLLSSLFWVFNFLGIGTQTEVARNAGAGRLSLARDHAGLAMAMGLAIGVVVALVGAPFAAELMGAMGAGETSLAPGVEYLRIRLLGGPAVLVTLAAFGALRGLQDMRTPLFIALAVNGLNALLDPLLIFGAGPVPALGLAGAGWASTGAQWLGAAAAVAAVVRRLGAPRDLDTRSARDLLVVGRDLFFRTGALMVFLTAATAAANYVGTEAGAAHQAVRQLWTFTAFLLDAYATAAQSLVGYFHGAGRRAMTRRVAAVTCLWSLGTGALLAAAMALATPAVTAAFVPETARAVFPIAWWIAVASQPINALSFATDGLHWGTGDYRFLRNGMGAATLLGGAGLLLFVTLGGAGLGGVWLATTLWIAVRAVLGVLRVWPGIGRSPYAPTGANRA